MTVRETSINQTRAVLELVLKERQSQEARYGGVNKTLVDGSGPNTRWLLPYTSHSARRIQTALREDYEDFEESDQVTWVHLVREEIAEAFQESDSSRLAQELVQVAALCVSWVERLVPEPTCQDCKASAAVNRIFGEVVCRDCAIARL